MNLKSFPPFKLDTVNHCLWRSDAEGNDIRVALTPKSYDLLIHFLDHAGRLITHEEAALAEEIALRRSQETKTINCPLKRGRSIYDIEKRWRSVRFAREPLSSPSWNQVSWSEKSWAHGMRVVFQVLNLLDRRQTVQDSEELTPIAFAPGYLDSVGRAVWFTVRRVF